jgi:circadian clock protein KaiC
MAKSRTRSQTAKSQTNKVQATEARTAKARAAQLARVPTGIGGLDTILHGGLLKSRIYIVQGRPGVGKTVFGNQVCFHHAGEQRTAIYVTLLAETHALMLEHMAGMSFFDPDKIPEQLCYLNGFTELLEHGLRGLAEMLRNEVRNRGASLLVLDGLLPAQQMAGSVVEYKRFIHELQVQASLAECTTLLLTSSGGEEISAEHTMVDGVIEMRDQLYGWRAESDIQVRKFRGGEFLRGRHAFEITDDGIAVFPRIEALYRRPSRLERTGNGKTSLGIEQLDKMLGGGVPTASTTVIMGPSGSGKTTLGMHFLAKSTAEDRGLLFGFYETPGRIAAKARGICSALTPKLRNGDVEVIWQPPTADMLDAFGEGLLRAVHQRKVRRLFIDGLSGFERAAVDLGRLPQYFTALANELRGLGVTTIYSAENAEILGPAVRAPLDGISGIAENLIMVRFVQQGAALHRLMSILKIRDSRFDSSQYRFSLTPNGIRIDDTPEQADSLLARPSAQPTAAPPHGRRSRSPRKS